MSKCESEIAALKEIISSGGGTGKGQPIAGASVNDIILLRNRVRLVFNTSRWNMWRIP
jgi:hypothetical protein